MAKWDIQDGFWRLNCREGEEWNFCYVWPQEPGGPRCLIVPNSLQMGWVELAPYFGAASGTARDVAVEYIEMEVGTVPEHTFAHWTEADKTNFNATAADWGQRHYFIEVYVDDLIVCIIATSQRQVEHVARGILHGIHGIFPPSEDDTTDPISHKKLCKGKGTFETIKCLLGFKFNGINKTIWLETERRAAILQLLHQWVRGAVKGKRGIPFAEFESVVTKLRHAFTALLEGRGLLSPWNWVIQRRPPVVYMHKDGTLLETITDIRTILQASTVRPPNAKIWLPTGRTTMASLMPQATAPGGSSWENF